jgi:ubiquinone/menaquinone biosynthesis C-methylase UbiE
MTPYKVNITYEPFALEPEYIESNRAFIANMALDKTQMVLDLACGIGTMTDLLLNRKKEITVTGIDISKESLTIAKDNFSKVGAFGATGSAVLSLIQASADCLPVANRRFDAVIMGNSIHLLPDKDRLLNEINRVLRPGGFLAFNSSFYAGTMPKGTEKFHHEWMKQAMSYIVSKDLNLRKQGRAGIPRKRGTVPGAFSHHWPSGKEWQNILEHHGFAIRYTNERTVVMTQSNFETIGAYGGFAKIILSGYPVEEASEALQATVAPSLAAVNMKTVPRLWLEVIAEKKNEYEKMGPETSAESTGKQ